MEQVLARERRGRDRLGRCIHLAAYLAGNAITQLSGVIGLVIGGVALFGIATVLIVVGRQTNRLGPAAEAAYPGPLE